MSSQQHPLSSMNNAEEENKDKDERIKQYKNMAKHEDMRRRRTECSVELRKQKRDELMMKRRNVTAGDGDDSDYSADDSQLDAVSGSPAAAPVVTKLTPQEIVQMLQGSPTIVQMRTAFEAIRRMLSRTKNPPVDDVINAGLLPALVQALTVEDEKVRFEAAWGLTNIVSGSTQQTIAVVQAGATPPLIDLCASNDIALAEQAVWAVANIAGDSAQLRDYVIQCGGVDALLKLIPRVPQMEEPFVRTLAWAFSNFCRHKNPHAPVPVLRAIAQGLRPLVEHSDRQVRQDACWAVSYLTDGPDEQIALAVEAGVLPAIREMLKQGDSLSAPALRVLGNMATGNDELTQFVIDLGTLNELPGLVERAKSPNVVKECCWLISNIIAGTQSQIDAVIQAGLLPLLITVLYEGDFKSQSEASWAVANLAQGGTSVQIEALYREKAVPALCRLLVQTNVDMLVNALETLNAILITVANLHPDEMNVVRDVVEEEGGLDSLERLQENQSEKVYSLAFRILSDFFGDDEDENVESAPLDPTAPYSF